MYVSSDFAPDVGFSVVFDRTLEANRFSGPLPSELGNLVDIERVYGLHWPRFLHRSDFGSLWRVFGLQLHKVCALLIGFCSLLSSNEFTGELPESLSQLTNLKDL